MHKDIKIDQGLLVPREAVKLGNLFLAQKILFDEHADALLRSVGEKPFAVLCGACRQVNGRQVEARSLGDVERRLGFVAGPICPGSIRGDSQMSAKRIRWARGGSAPASLATDDDGKIDGCKRVSATTGCRSVFSKPQSADAASRRVWTG